MAFRGKRGIVFLLVVVIGLMGNAAPVSARPAETPSIQSATGGVSVSLPSGPINVRSGPGTGYGILGRANKGQSFALTGKNREGTWWEIDYGGRKGWISGQLVKASGATESVPVVAAPPLPKAAPKAAAPATAGYFGYGIQIDPWADRGKAIGQVHQLGFNWVKFQLPWKDFEGTQGQKNFPDDIVNDLNGNGLNILASIVKSPNWARPANTDFGVEGPPADPATYASYVGEFARRYCGRVQAVEVWNEQNLHYEWGNEPLDPNRYVQLLAAAYRAIKGACPQMVVVSGALTPTGAPAPWAIDDFTYLERMYRAGLRNYSDAIGAHPSGFNVGPDVTWQGACDFIKSQGSSYVGPCNTPHHSWSFRSTMEGYRNIMTKYGDARKRLWPTEFGWASGWSGNAGYEYANDNSAEEQAAWTVRAYEMMRNWGFVGPAFLWNLNYTHGELGQWRIENRPAFGALAGMPK
jgi:hypothetical protein